MTPSRCSILTAPQHSKMSATVRKLFSLCSSFSMFTFTLSPPRNFLGFQLSSYLLAWSPFFLKLTPLSLPPCLCFTVLLGPTFPYTLLPNTVQARTQLLLSIAVFLSPPTTQLPRASPSFYVLTFTLPPASLSLSHTYTHTVEAQSLCPSLFGEWPSTWGSQVTFCSATICSCLAIFSAHTPLINHPDYELQKKKKLQSDFSR